MDVQSLTQELENLENEGRGLASRLQTVRQKTHLLRQLIAIETQEEIPEQKSLFPENPVNGSGKPNLKEFVLGALGDGAIWTIDGLKDFANRSGFDAGSNSPGRSMNFALINLRRAGLVDRVEKGQWRLHYADVP